MICKPKKCCFVQRCGSCSPNLKPLSLSKAAEWLPDNFYLVRQTCRQIREDMPASFYRQLPKRDVGPLKVSVGRHKKGASSLRQSN